MEQQPIQIGDTVTAIYKTGKYIGEVTNVGSTTFLVKVLGVLKHPMQGDLHNPKQVDVAMFHTRRALAFREQTNVPQNMVKPFSGEIPNYLESLRQAVDKMKQELQDIDQPWNQKSLETIEELEADYFK